MTEETVTQEPVDEYIIDATTQEEGEAEDATRVLLARLREQLLASDPGVAPELVAGETLEELDASFLAAQAIAARARESVTASAFSAGGGAPGRFRPEPRSAIEKIREGLAVR